MGYLHINNLYKDQTILMFKECYALEKIHGTSAHISFKDKVLKFFSGGKSYEKFVALFNKEQLTSILTDKLLDNIVIYGEAYGGKQQGMSSTYGKELKFIVFDIKIGDYWLNVPDAENLTLSLGLEFVHYKKVSTDLESLNYERDKDSTQAIINGVGEGKKQEGVILKPLIEMYTKTGDRVIAKHKRDEFRETKTPREVSPEKFAVMENAKAIAEEWVTPMRLEHVLDKLPKDINIESTKIVITAMIEDVYREAKGEIIESKEVSNFISSKTAQLFKQKLQSNLV